MRTSLYKSEQAHQDQAIRAVLAERDRQDERWGVNFRLNPDTFCRILGEEFGEVCRAVDDEGPHRVYEECVQVAAVAVRMAVAALQEIEGWRTT